MHTKLYVILTKGNKVMALISKANENNTREIIQNLILRSYSYCAFAALYFSLEQV